MFCYFVCCFFMFVVLLFFFFFSSRRRHTRFDCDWSSDVCSSDLRFPTGDGGTIALCDFASAGASGNRYVSWLPVHALKPVPFSRDNPLRAVWRSEERRVGKECRSRGWGWPCKKKEDSRVSIICIA